MKKLIVSSDFASTTLWHFQMYLLSSCVCLHAFYTLVPPLVKLQQPVDVMRTAPATPSPILHPNICEFFHFPAPFFPSNPCNLSPSGGSRGITQSN